MENLELIVRDRENLDDLVVLLLASNVFIPHLQNLKKKINSVCELRFCNIDKRTSFSNISKLFSSSQTS